MAWGQPIWWIYNIVPVCGKSAVVRRLICMFTDIAWCLYVYMLCIRFAAYAWRERSRFVVVGWEWALPPPVFGFMPQRVRGPGGSAGRRARRRIAQEGLLLVGRGSAEAHGGRAKGGDAVVIGDHARFGGETGSHPDRRRFVRRTVRPGGQRTRYCRSKYPVLQEQVSKQR